MKKKLSLIISSIILSQVCFAQTSSVDSTQFKYAALEACKCIDSIEVTNKDAEEIAAEINICIDKEVVSYQIMSQMMNQLLNLSKEDSSIININTNKKSTSYKKDYYTMERWLMDSCYSIGQKVSANNKESEYSISKNPQARAEYDKGIPFFEQDSYNKAIPYFKKAVAIDPTFVFAWDNLGVCYRRINEYQKAIDAYKESLKYDPKGKTALQNLPVAYQFLKEYNKSIAAYKDILKYYPNDPEVYYGIGIIQSYYVIDLEKALDNMCKAYLLYIKNSSPYRVDAEKQINYIFGEMKKVGKETLFNKILTDNNISTE